MTAPHEVLAQLLSHLRSEAAKVFAEEPETQSIAVLVAQYFADGAEDECHLTYISSTREVPLWPRHGESFESYGIDGESYPNIASFAYAGHGIDDEDVIDALAPFCIEDGSQSENESYNYRPLAIARRDGRVELVGELHRSYVGVDEPEVDPMWDDPRAVALFADVAAAPDDDEPRRVLADHLIERGHPRGEYIALALAGRHAEAEALLARNLVAWTGALVGTVPLVNARFARGFLAGCTVAELATASPLWRTVEDVELVDGTLHEDMTALRVVRGANTRALHALAEASRPWRIVELEATIDAEGASALATATTLPELRVLVALGAPPIVAPLVGAPWWPQLERLVVETRDPIEIFQWMGRRTELGVPLAVRPRASSGQLGWELRLFDDRIEVLQCSWHPAASLEQLVELRQLAGPPRIVLVPSRYWAPDAAIARTLEDLGGGIVSCAGEGIE